jgi:N-acetylglucosamine kinase-like BadF-type ATPase
MRKIYLGVDVGGTKTAVVLSARPPETLGRVEFATMPERGPQHALDHIVESARSLLGAARLWPGIDRGHRR